MIQLNENKMFLQTEIAGFSDEDLYDYFRFRKSVVYFPVADEEETRREKIEAISENVFTFNNETFKLPEKFDWHKNPSDDIEWLIMLHKFYYAVGLGKLYTETRNTKYVHKWVELTEYWIDSVEPGFIATDVTGRRIQNWIFAHYYFVTEGQTAEISPQIYRKFLRSLHEQIDYLCRNLTPSRNHRTLELYAIFLGAVVFPEMKDSKRWLDFSLAEITKNIKDDLLEDGVHCELSTDYHHIVLKNLLGIRKLAKVNQIPFDCEADNRIRQALEFAKYIHKPDGYIPALSDGDSGCFLDLLHLGYELYGDPELLYVASRGKLGIRPHYRSRGFHESGYYVLRSGWGERGNSFADERYLVFDCGPLGRGNHGHFDLLNMEMAAFGRSLIVDPGRYTYNETDDINWRVHFRSTGSHNTVLVDGKNQIRYTYNARKGKFKIAGPEPEYELKQFIHKENADLLHGVARSHEYSATHERQIFFACLDYWIISDLLYSDRSHEYELRFHLSNEAHGKVNLTETGSSVSVHAPHLIITQSSNSSLTYTIDSGYISPVYGKKLQAPILKTKYTGHRVLFHSILFPYKSCRPEIHIEQLHVQSDAGLHTPEEVTALRVTIQQYGYAYTDIYFNRQNLPERRYSFADFIFDGRILFLRSNTITGESRIIYKEEKSYFAAQTAGIEIL